MSEANLPNAKPRAGVLIALILGVAVLFTMVLWQVSFRDDLNPRTTNQTLIFAALSAFIFLLFVALTFVLLRNLLKLYAERRIGVLGSKFRSRMVVGALILSVIPVCVLFLCAYGLMNRSIERWFSRPVEELHEDSNRVAGLLSAYAQENAHAEAQAIAEMPETERAFATSNSSSLADQFRVRQRTMQGGFALALADGSLLAGYNSPEAWGDLRKKIPLPSIGPQSATPFTLNGRDYIMGTAQVANNPHNVVLVAIPLPPEFRQTLNHIAENDNMYRELGNQRKQLRRTYMGLLLLINMIVLFAAVWLALFLSKLVTRPVAALAAATQEISRGHLDYRVEIPATDELGELIASFNRMAAELEGSRHAIEASSSQLAGANVELEQRRRDIETILETIPTGVLTLDASGSITRANHALTRMLIAITTARGGSNFPVGASLSSLFHEEVVADLETMMRKADRMGSVTSQMEVQVSRTSLDVAVTVAALHLGPQKLGYVIVFEDLSDLLKAQKQAAWREVARRVAHEIKNPLTPIALSAERIRRHLERGHPPDEASLQIIGTCSHTIAEAVETVRTLVDEFSAMARFPASQPQPSDINSIIQSALSMFNGRLEGIQVNTYLAPDLPPVMADPNAMKRVIANIIDNAAEAMQDSLVREVHISTALIQSGEMVEIVIADTGHGVSREVKERLFLPYFSTKKRGTGLGLAIVGRIIEDHHGSVRIEENSPLGTRFIVELPVANGAAVGAAKKIEQPDHA